jgi:hypothetical protein
MEQMMARKPPPVVIDTSDSSWHLDRKVPVAIIITILMQTGGIIWWGATAAERLSALERKVESAAPQAERLTKVETRLEAVQDGISEIKSILRKEPPPSKTR